MSTNPITHLVTLQFANGDLFDGKPTDGLAHLVRGTRRGTPGPTLCGIDRFANDTPGWSAGGGISGPGITHTPCSGCLGVAQQEFPGLPVTGYVGGREVAAALGAERIR
jgi:hypothetical protein